MTFSEMCWCNQRISHRSTGAELADSFCSSVNSDRTPTNCAVFSTGDTFGCPDVGLCASVAKGMARRAERSKPLAKLISIMMAHDPPWPAIFYRLCKGRNPCPERGVFGLG